MDPAFAGKLVAFLIWGVVVGLLAKRKGRNPWGWGVAGGVSWTSHFLILAFLPSLQMPKMRSVAHERARQEHDMPHVRIV